MRTSFLYGLLLVLAWGLQPATATMHITNDRGGRIGDYIDKYQYLRNSDEKVVIDGLCASACTLVLMLPKKQICATQDAVLAFHQAYDFGTASVGGRTVNAVIPNPLATELLFSYYPKPVRTWIKMHNGMPVPSQLLKLQGRELARFVPRCPQPGTLSTIY